MKNTMKQLLGSVKNYFCPVQAQTKTDLLDTMTKTEKPELSHTEEIAYLKKTHAFDVVAQTYLQNRPDQEAILDRVDNRNNRITLKKLLAELIRQNGGYVGGSFLYKKECYENSDKNTAVNDLDIFFTNEEQYHKFIAQLHKIAQGTPTFVDTKNYKGCIYRSLHKNNALTPGETPHITRRAIDVHLVEEIISPAGLLQFEKVRTHMKEKLLENRAPISAKYVTGTKHEVKGGEIVELPVYGWIDIAYFENDKPIARYGRDQNILDAGTYELVPHKY